VSEDTQLAEADALVRAGALDEALAAYLHAGLEAPSPALCVKLARLQEQRGEHAEAFRWAITAADTGVDFRSWIAAEAVARRNAQAGPAPRRTARVALLGSYTTAQLTPMLWLAARRFGVELEVFEGGYCQYRQQILDPESETYRFAPDLIVLAVHAGELELPAHSARPEEDVAAEVQKWQGLWRVVGDRADATVIQHLFALPPEAPFGHLGATLPGTFAAMGATVNQELARSASEQVAVVDCERLAALVGKREWFDRRYWHLAKQAVSLAALPLLARHTAAVIAARRGLSKKCLAFDLDNTVWGGVVGEEGVQGIALGDTPAGEAFQAFQEAILDLGRRGIILAVCSKNNLGDAVEVFEQHPGMRIRRDDIAAFVADWRPKSDQLRSVADTLGIGLDSIVFVDDNPVEREAIRQLAPEVDVINLPSDPADYVATLDDYVLFEPAAFTPEDADRAKHYAARQAAAELAAGSDTLEEFYESLEMRAKVSRFNDTNLPRVAQLVGKTNQFNLTTRRHSLQALQGFAQDPACVHLSFSLADRFGDHGLIALAIAFVRGQTLEVDSFLMSCRVIGRTLEDTMLDELTRAALGHGCTVIRGVYIPTAKNGLVRELYLRLGFELARVEDGTTEWVREIGPGDSGARFIEVQRSEQVLA
jgi:FkbH-like protein